MMYTLLSAGRSVRIAPKRSVYTLFPPDFFDDPEFDEKVASYRTQTIKTLQEDNDIIRSLQKAMSTERFQPGLHGISGKRRPSRHQLLRRSDVQPRAMNQTFDYIIIGAGSAGCVMANRLTLQGDAKVCVLEAGPRDSNIFIHIPAGWYKTVSDASINWLYHTEPSEGSAGRQNCSAARQDPGWLRLH